MTQDQERLFHDGNTTVDAVLDLLGEWIAEDTRAAVSPGLSETDRAHACGRSDSLFDFRDRILELRAKTRKVE